MPDLLQSASTWLAAQMKTNVGQSITALRGSQAIGVGLKATYGQTTFEQDDGNGGFIRHQTKDFIIMAADYTIGGVVVEPRNEDKLIDSTGTYAALSDNGSPCFRYTDAHHTQLRIHTKQVS